MAISFQGSPGALFNALGKLGLVVKQVAAYQAAQKTNYIDPTNGVYAQLNGAVDIQAIISTAYLTDLSGPEVSCFTVQQIAQQYLNRLVWLDNPQPNQDLTSVNLTASITEMIRQMKQQGQTVLQMTITATPGTVWQNVDTPPGNPVMVVSTYRPVDGLLLENSFSEPIQVTCASDSFTGGATAFNEPFSLTGEAPIGDVFAWNWPQGSGASISVNAIDGSTDAGSGNYLTNSDFEDWTTTANVPDNWTLDVGTAGTNTLQQTSIVYSGTSSLELVGDGSSTLTTLSQTFGASPGTSATLSPETQYACNLFLRRGGASVTQGVLRVALVDTNNAVLNDNAGTPCSFTIDLTTLTTGWSSFNGAFRTPYNAPSVVKLQLSLTTSLPNGVPVFVDKVSFGVMSQLYTSGPYVSIHAGNVPSTVNDYNKITITNSRGAGGTLSTFQTLCNQFYSLQSQDVLIPSSFTPSISDTLIS